MPSTAPRAGAADLRRALPPARARHGLNVSRDVLDRATRARRRLLPEAELRAGQHEPVEACGEQGANERPHDVWPGAAELIADQRRAEPAGRVERAAREGAQD